MTWASPVAAALGAGAVCAAALAACGSTPQVDSGGFTAAERQRAQTALDGLRRTSMPRRVVALSYQAGQAPSLCVVIPKAGADGVYDLVLAWRPTSPAYRTAQGVLEGTVGGGTTKDEGFRVTSFGGRVPEPVSVKATLLRAELAKPAERCEVLEDGQLQLVSP